MDVPLATKEAIDSLARSEFEEVITRTLAEPGGG
jgi:hypothetical protein